MKSITFLLATVVAYITAAPSAVPSYTAESLKTATAEGPVCAYLKNAHFKEYLYTTSSVIDSTNRVRVFTWMNKADGPASEWKNTWGIKYDNQGLWLMEKKSDCLNCYSIKSLYDKDLKSQDLFSVSNMDPEFRIMRPRRPVYSYRVDNTFPESEGENSWSIETVPSGDRSHHVRIQSKTIGKATGEILYAVGEGETFDTERRSVFTWSSHGDSEAFTEQGEWIVEKADCPLSTIL